MEHRCNSQVIFSVSFFLVAIGDIFLMLTGSDRRIEDTSKRDRPDMLTPLMQEADIKGADLDQITSHLSQIMYAMITHHISSTGPNLQ